MKKTKKDAYYQKIHNDLAQKFGLMPKTVQKIRTSHSQGFSKQESIDHFKKRLKSSEFELQRLIQNMKVKQEIIEVLETYSTGTINEILEG